MEIKREVKSIEIDMKCDKCGDAFMRYDGTGVLMSNPPQYPHVCSLCGNKENYRKKYPYIVYE